eukprot:gb/GECH01006738.1/.p1 GENE.gb/GECH01006738.1/~~gb/GECH01006738.1/.p1  ORF type:complete len:161 (+),score=50.74 gb/GECH01006738.1/:1-483(+)
MQGSSSCPPPAEEENTKVLEMFKIFDRDNDGFIDEHEFARVLSVVGSEMLTVGTVRQYFKVADVDGNGVIDIEEFTEVMEPLLRKQISEKELKFAFEIFDKDFRGEISPLDLKYMMNALGIQTSDDEVRLIFKSADKDRDGVLNMNEFSNAIFNSSQDDL